MLLIEQTYICFHPKIKLNYYVIVMKTQKNKKLISYQKVYIPNMHSKSYIKILVNINLRACIVKFFCREFRNLEDPDCGTLLQGAPCSKSHQLIILIS